MVTRDCWTYQRYIKISRAEFCVAKHGYVATHCGWFSDRTTAYLAQVDQLLSRTQDSVAFFHAVKDYCHTEAGKKQLLQ
jgi:hypothetical protein